MTILIYTYSYHHIPCDLEIDRLDTLILVPFHPDSNPNPSVHDSDSSRLKFLQITFFFKFYQIEILRELGYTNSQNCYEIPGISTNPGPGDSVAYPHSHQPECHLDPKTLDSHSIEYCHPTNPFKRLLLSSMGLDTRMTREMVVFLDVQ